MAWKKKLKTKETIEAWTYDTGVYEGMSLGIFDKMCGNSKAVVSVECAETADGIVNRIVIRKAKAEKYGFKIVVDET